MTATICSLYQFADCPDFEVLRVDLLATTRQLGIKGSLLAAPEGLNGTISGTQDAIDRFVIYLTHDPIFAGRFAHAEIKYATAEHNPFVRMKVRLKREIVTLRAPDADPRQRTGTYVTPTDWNALIEDPEIVLVDTRNAYETQAGMFRGAVDPSIRTFTGFKQWASENLNPDRDKKIAMYCTGGIRCEKASAYLLNQGFQHVYQLKGGILAYMDKVPADESQFEGACFVFDARGAVAPL
ncbi:rhodanese-related sulfurtransferase [Candidatus Phycosocius spiralis]|uniref:tRNA uridine(34) hydroxylase n=1 Tax=Candidatus Phycosocius spiralis TaxID=2815099 RepID=A0ABQ4PY17_9PROT|nr:rhodanese-like domain-containing protein [Candidatus Phycosocius spiralis]GIU67569.1 UPF0176 protein [Candidatus Phycosocius spiralis]